MWFNNVGVSLMDVSFFGVPVAAVPHVIDGAGATAILHAWQAPVNTPHAVECNPKLMAVLPSLRFKYRSHWRRVIERRYIVESLRRWIRDISVGQIGAGPTRGPSSPRGTA